MLSLLSNNFLNCFVGYSGGAVNVMMYNWRKKFKPGQKIKIHVSSQLPIKQMSYQWGDGKKVYERSFLNRFGMSDFKITVPKTVNGELPVLNVISEVIFENGEVREHVHDFAVNNFKE